MKKELMSRSDGFQQELERFAARWHQLKPANIDADADKKICIEAINNIKDRRAEFNDIVQRCEKLKLVKVSQLKESEILYQDGIFNALFLKFCD